MKDTLLDALAVTIIAVVILVAINLVIYVLLFIQGVALIVGILCATIVFVLSLCWALFRIIDRR